MISVNLPGVAALVLRHAQRNGYILPHQVRTVLSEAGLCESMWKDVLSVASSSLTYRKGRYYYTTPVNVKMVSRDAIYRFARTDKSHRG